MCTRWVWRSLRRAVIITLVSEPSAGEAVCSAVFHGQGVVQAVLKDSSVTAAVLSYVATTLWWSFTLAAQAAYLIARACPAAVAASVAAAALAVAIRRACSALTKVRVGFDWGGEAQCAAVVVVLLCAPSTHSFSTVTVEVADGVVLTEIDDVPIAAALEGDASAA